MNIGVILAHFQSVGKQPVEIDLLNNLVRLGAIARAVDFNILADTPSKPVDLAGFRFCNNSSVGKGRQVMKQLCRLNTALQ